MDSPVGSTLYLSTSVIAYIWGYESVPAYVQKDMSKLNAYGGLFR